MAGSMLRLRAAAAAGGYRQFSSSAAYLMLPSNKMYSLGEKKVMSIDSCKVEKEFESDKVVGSSHGWVGLMKEEEDRGRSSSSSSLSLWNPISGSRMKLPPLDTIKRTDHYFSLRVERLIVDDADCSRAIICGHFANCRGWSMNFLGVCCPGRCNEWTLFGHDRRYSYLDAVACSQTRVIYTMNTNSELARWNVSDPRRPHWEWKKNFHDLEDEDEDENENFPRGPDHDLLRYKYVHLVYAEQSGQLFHVRRHYVEGTDPNGAAVDNVEDLWKSGIYPNKTVSFDVDLLTENNYDKGRRRRRKLQLRYMDPSLDGLVMFVGINGSFAVAAADFPHLNPDSIYFTDHKDNIPELVDGGHDIGIYDYKNNTISACYYPSLRSFKGIRPLPFWLSPTSKG